MAPNLDLVGPMRKAKQRDGGDELTRTAALAQVSHITTTHEFDRVGRDTIGPMAT